MTIRPLLIRRVLAAAALAGAVWVPTLASATTTTESMPPGKPQAERNAALLYWRAWESADPQVMKADIDWAEIGQATDPARLPPSFKAAAATLAASNEAVQLLVRASSLPVCDFELAYEEGFDLVLPHLGKFRGGARMLRIDARRLAVDGNLAEASERVAAMLRMSGQLRGEGVLISSLVGMAIAGAAIDEAEALLGTGVLTRDAAAPITLAARQLDTPDAHGVRACITGEGDIFRNWIARSYNGSKAGAEFVAKWADQAGAGDAQTTARQDSARRKVMAMDGQALLAEADRMLEGYRMVDLAWDSTEAEATIGKITADARKGAFGELGVVFFPGFEKPRAAVARFEARLADLRRRLTDLR